MDSTRQNKVSRLLLKELSDIFLKEAKQHFNNVMVTLTVVRVTPDLGLAKVYLSIFPNNKIEETLATINDINKNIRHVLAKRVRHQLRIIPELKFYIDDSLDYVENIENLLNN